MKVEMRAIEEITPYEKNPRMLRPDAVDAVAQSILTYGFRQPIVVDPQFVIIIGHTRWLAAQKLKLAEVPVHIAKLSDTESRALRIADNRLAEMSTWDNALLAEEMIMLEETPVGFDESEFEALRVLAEDDYTMPGFSFEQPPPSPIQSISFEVPREHAEEIRAQCRRIIDKYLN